MPGCDFSYISLRMEKSSCIFSTGNFLSGEKLVLRLTPQEVIKTMSKKRQQFFIQGFVILR
jgi:hypothetical protein